MTNALRVGVIGLGQRWRRHYRAALLQLRNRFEVCALCDQCQSTAKEEADLLSRRKGITPVPLAGPTALLAREDVEAVLLPDPQWFRLWPIEVACRFGKPVLCEVPLQLDDAHADLLHQQVLEHRLPVMMGTLPGLAGLTARLREILDTRLSSPQFIVCKGTSPLESLEKSSTEDRKSRSSLAIRDPRSSILGFAGILPLLNWCVSLLGDEPKSVLAGSADSGGLTNILLHFDSDRAVQVLHYLAPYTHCRLEIEIVTDRGWICLSPPDRIRWADSEGWHTHRLPKGQCHGMKMLEDFCHVVKEGSPPNPSLLETFRALQWLRAAQQSRQEGHRVNL